jgi:hypothetical protein
MVIGSLSPAFVDGEVKWSRLQDWRSVSDVHDCQASGYWRRAPAVDAEQ